MSAEENAPPAWGKLAPREALLVLSMFTLDNGPGSLVADAIDSIEALILRYEFCQRLSRKIKQEADRD